MSLKQPAIVLTAVALSPPRLRHPLWPNPKAVVINTIA